MTATTKYTAAVQPPSANQRVFLSEELRKIAAVTSSFLAALEDLEDMALSEIGSFRPVIIGLTTAGVGTYSVQEGQFYRINRLIVVQLRCVTSAHTGTGQACVTGLPYRAKVFAGTLGHVPVHVFSDTNSVRAGLIPTTSPDRINLYAGTPSAPFAITANMDFLLNVAYITES